jgi:hypothetical protein
MGGVGLAPRDFMVNRRTWVVTPGRCGSTSFMRGLRELGLWESPDVHRDNSTEHRSFVRVNTAILGEVDSPEENADGRGWIHSIPGEPPAQLSMGIRQAMWEVFHHAPSSEIVKDPRFSVTLPYWFAEGLVPDTILRLTRDARRVARSWGSMFALSRTVEEMLPVIKWRERTLDTALSSFGGEKHLFILNDEGHDPALAEYISERWGVSPDAALEALNSAARGSTFDKDHARFNS